jgi:hypothetical protein
LYRSSPAYDAAVRKNRHTVFKSSAVGLNISALRSKQLTRFYIKSSIQLRLKPQTLNEATKSDSKIAKSSRNKFRKLKYAFRSRYNTYSTLPLGEAREKYKQFQKYKLSIYRDFAHFKVFTLSKSNLKIRNNKMLSLVKRLLVSAKTGDSGATSINSSDRKV